MQPTDPQPYTPTQPTPQPAPQAANPGKTAGVVGFIFAFVGLQIPGLILSIIGFNKSKRAGIGNGLALAGIILNSLGILVSLIVIPILVSTTLVSYNAITLRANTVASESAASSVIKYSEVHAADNDSYPTTFSDISTSADLSYITLAKSTLTSEPETVSTIEFQTCGSEGNKIGYWDYEDEQVLYLYSGTASRSSTCVLSSI